MRLKDAKHVAEWRLCVGCGTCDYVYPENKIKLIDVINDGIRPNFDSESCMDVGYVIAERAAPDVLYLSQKNLLRKRQAIWGRLLAMKALGIPIPKLEGFHLFENWSDLSAREKVRSILGTVRRIIQRKYFVPMKFDSEVIETLKL